MGPLLLRPLVPALPLVWCRWRRGSGPWLCPWASRAPLGGPGHSGEFIGTRSAVAHPARRLTNVLTQGPGLYGPQALLARLGGRQRETGGGDSAARRLALCGTSLVLPWAGTSAPSPMPLPLTPLASGTQTPAHRASSCIPSRTDHPDKTLTGHRQSQPNYRGRPWPRGHAEQQPPRQHAQRSPVGTNSPGALCGDESHWPSGGPPARGWAVLGAGGRDRVLKGSILWPDLGCGRGSGAHSGWGSPAHRNAGLRSPHQARFWILGWGEGWGDAGPA